jgi:hypothetical protein
VVEREAFRREFRRLGLGDARLEPRAERELTREREILISPWPDQDCAKSRPSAAETEKRAQALAALIWKGATTRKPHADSAVGGRLFSGSYDWHSAVHAHWALLSIARVHSNAKLEATLKKRLTQAALKAERSFLAADKNTCFELPYGRAWLLLVLDELSRRTWAPPIARALRLEIELKLWWWLEEAPFPESGTGSAAAFSAAHDSYLFTFMLVLLSRPQTSGLEAALATLFTKKIQPQQRALAGVSTSKSDFMDLQSILWVIERLLPSAKPRALLTMEVPFEKPPLDRTNAHSAGAAMVRLWPFAMDSKTDTAACARFHSRMNEMFAREDQWKDSFEHVAHWVPQFMWMGMWLEAGRP